MVNFKTTAKVLIILVIICSIFVGLSFISKVQSAINTQTTLTADATSAVHSSFTQPPEYVNFTVSLTSSGTGLVGREVLFAYRAVGATTWTNLAPVTVDSSGQAILSIPVEYVVAGVCGDYEFIASYNPNTEDSAIFAASQSSIVPLTLVPHPLETPTLVLSTNATVVEHSSMSQPPQFVNFSVSLTSGGNALANRQVLIMVRPSATPTWTPCYGTTTDSTGQGSALLPVEIVAGGITGSYQFMANYNVETNPSDASDYIGANSSIVTVTLNPHVLEPTTLTLTTNATNIEHSSASTMPQYVNFSVTLTKCDSGLANKQVSFLYRPVGTETWSICYGFTTDYLGQSYALVPPEMVAGGVCGNYEFMASYIPMSGDESDYLGSNSSIITITLNPHTLKTPTLSITISPAVFEHSSNLQAIVQNRLSVSLTSDGVGLPSRSISIYHRAIGTDSWTQTGSSTLNSDGQIPSDVFPVENIVLGVVGQYEFKAVYTPEAGDATDYYSAEDTCLVTMNYASMDLSFIVVQSHHALAFHGYSTGISVDIVDSSLDDLFEFGVTTQNYGTTIPPGASNIVGINGHYYDVKVQPNSGPIGDDVMVTVRITDPSFVSGSLVSYWDGTAWKQVTATFIAPHTVTFTVPATMLSGTPFAVYQPSIFDAPEYPLGALLAVTTCFAAIVAFNAIKKPKLHLP